MLHQDVLTTEISYLFDKYFINLTKQHTMVHPPGVSSGSLPPRIRPTGQGCFSVLIAYM